jgi:hypothetical protein
MSTINRPSLDVLVPLVMMENEPLCEGEGKGPTSNDSDRSEQIRSDGDVFVVRIRFQIDILRYFDSGDLVLIRQRRNFLPGIVFNATGLVMKFDSKRSL